MDKDKPSLCPHCGKKLNHVIMEIDRERKISALYKMDYKNSESKVLRTYEEADKDDFNAYCAYCGEKIFNDPETISETNEILKILKCIKNRPDGEETEYDLNDLTMCHNCGHKLDEVIITENTNKEYKINHSKFTAEQTSFEEQDYDPIVICKHCEEQVDDAQQDYILSIIEGVI